MLQVAGCRFAGCRAAGCRLQGGLFVIRKIDIGSFLQKQEFTALSEIHCRQDTVDSCFHRNDRNKKISTAGQSEAHYF